jgi:hypothetical protein
MANGLPFELGPRSNGEYLPYPRSPKVHEAVRRTLAHADTHARRLATSRRRFLQSLGGAATMLFFLAACDEEERRSRGEEPGGTFRVTSTTTTDPDAARDALTGREFVFDVQTHLLEFDLASGDAPGGFGRVFPYAACGEDDWRACFGADHWLEELFVRSDTTMAVISAVPILATPNPLSIEVMEAARAAARDVCGADGRVFLHGQVNPNVGDLAVALDGMRALAAQHPIGAWKVYTHVPEPLGWWLDDHDADAVQCGNAFLEAVREVGPPIVCVHKGFGGGSEYSSPADVGPAAKANPDITFVVYHSGYDGPGEGPYSPDASPRGIDRFLASLDAAGVGAGENVYAELGSTWWNAMRDPTEAAHVLGKLLARLGEDRVLWGTDSIWYGSPQDQIQAFRTFEISERFQEEYGYPALTETVKRKVLGANAAALYGVEPVAARCTADQAALEDLRAAMAPKRSYGPATAAEARVLMRAHGLRV